MAALLEDYRLAAEEIRGKLHEALASGTSNVEDIATIRTLVEFMDEDLRLRPTETINLFNKKSESERGVRGPFLWQKDAIERAKTALRPYAPTESEYKRKISEYLDATRNQLQKLGVKEHTGGNCEVRYFTEERIEETDAGGKGPEQIAKEEARDAFLKAVEDWIAAHRFDPVFYRVSALSGLGSVLGERQDIVLALRAVWESRRYKVSFSGPEVDTWQSALEIGVGCLPIVGNAMALVEATQGRDLFCRTLSPFERVLALVSVFIPAFGRLVRLGRAAYTSTRLARLYGRDAAKWSYILQMGERATLNPAETETLRRAGREILAGKSLSQQAVKDAEKALKTLMGKSVGSSPSAPVAIRRTLLEAMRKLGNAKATLAELDELALQRVVDKGSTKLGQNLGKAKGQLLEELLESRIAQLLRDKFGAKALGIEAGKHKIEHIPGHLLRDSANREITDGIVARRLAVSEIQQVWYGARSAQEIERIKGVLRPWAVVEAKGGAPASKKLSYIYKKTNADIAEIKAVAQKRFENALLKAAKTGKPHSGTLEKMETEVAAEYRLAEYGGQVRMSLERLDKYEDGSLTSIFVGQDEYLLDLVGVSRLKVFGVLPQNVPSKAVVKRLTDPVKKGGEGLNFEVLGVNIAEQELEDLAKEVLRTAATAK